MKKGTVLDRITKKDSWCFAEKPEGGVYYSDNCRCFLCEEDYLPKNNKGRRIDASQFEKLFQYPENAMVITFTKEDLATMREIAKENRVTHGGRPYIIVTREGNIGFNPRYLLDMMGYCGKYQITINRDGFDKGSYVKPIYIDEKETVLTLPIALFNDVWEKKNKLVA